MILIVTAAAIYAQNPPKITSRQVVERIQKQIGVSWREQTVDTFKAGDPDMPIKGIATTMMATYEMLERAGKAGRNLIITHEPTFYGHFDRLDELAGEGDRVLAAKQALIKKYNLVIWRFHDHWHMRRPDGIYAGVTRALGWETYNNSSDHRVFRLPQTSLAALASELKRKLGAKAIRVIGDPKMKVMKVGLAPGAGGYTGHRKLLQRDDVEVLIYGEAPEWETALYGDDASAAGLNKALIILGHIPSEQAGMEECARWLKGFVTEVPVEFIPTKEPFWSPK